MGFLNISGGTENHTTPKTWEKKIDITQEKYGKKQTFESYDFLKYFRQKSIQFPKYGKSEFT